MVTHGLIVRPLPPAQAQDSMYNLPLHQLQFPCTHCQSAKVKKSIPHTAATLCMRLLGTPRQAPRMTQIGLRTAAAAQCVLQSAGAATPRGRLCARADQVPSCNGCSSKPVSKHSEDGHCTLTLAQLPQCDMGACQLAR